MCRVSCHILQLVGGCLQTATSQHVFNNFTFDVLKACILITNNEITWFKNVGWLFRNINVGNEQLLDDCQCNSTSMTIAFLVAFLVYVYTYMYIRDLIVSVWGNASLQTANDGNLCHPFLFTPHQGQKIGHISCYIQLYKKLLSDMNIRIKRFKYNFKQISNINKCIK